MMTRVLGVLVLGGILILVATSALAQPSALMGADTSTLSEKEERAVQLSREWISRRDMPTRGNDGRVIFNYGGTLPSIVCAPLQACDLELQPGEIARNLYIGDSVRWKVAPGKSGPVDNETTHLIIKVTELGISTSMVVTTDRRTYNIRLVSRKGDWMPRVAFVYPEDVDLAWASYHNAESRYARTSTVPSGDRLEDLDFNYQIKGKGSFVPIRVYNNGVKTYIQMPKTMSQTEAPALLVIGPDKAETLVNYRLLNDTYIVDQVFDSAVLIAGVGGSQNRVTLKRTGDKK